MSGAADEIGASATTGRQHRTRVLAKPNEPTSGAANTAAKPSRRSTRTTPVPIAGSSIADSIPGASRGGVIQEIGEVQAASDHADIVAQLAALQRMRRHAIVSQSRSDRSMESLIAQGLGARIDAEPAARKAVYAQAKAYRLRVERGGEAQSRDVNQSKVGLSVIDSFILASAQGRAVWDDQRERVEGDMRRLARLLPVYPFAQTVRGLGDLGLAILAAEAGIPIGDYRTVQGLWKRMGLAVIDGQRQRMVTGAAAMLHGYNPVRRAEVWAICSDSLFRHQWAGEKIDPDTGDVLTPAGPTGPYGEVYGRRRAHTLPRQLATADLDGNDPAKWSKGRCHNDARRVMTKELLKDLWQAWRKAA